MTRDRADLDAAYAGALEHYVRAPAETSLEAAYELARKAMAEGRGILEVASAHQRALEHLLASPPGAVSAADVPVRAEQFLIEALSPFEMTLRGFGEAIGRLEHEVAERTGAQQALRAARDHLEERVTQRTAELSAANARLQREVAERERAERALREAEISYQSLVASVRDYAIFMLDPDGRVATWSPGAQRFKGYLPEEIIGKHFSVFYTPEDRESGRPEQVLASAVRSGSCENEGWRVRKDGSRYWADVVVTALRAEDGHLKGFTKVARDVTERRQAQQALEELNRQLQEANREKDEFVALISHELRNPLSAILGGVEVLSRTLPSDERSRRAFDIIRRSAQVQKRLIGDLLDLSRLRRNSLTLQYAPVALDVLAQNIVSGEEAEATASRLAMGLDVEPDLWVLGDVDRLQQVLLNLIGNAMKFTPPGGRIDVRAFRCGDPVESVRERTALTRVPSGPAHRAGASSICVVVEDTGIGMDRPLLARIFNPFEQGEVASQRQRGLGLGLALVKLIVEKQAGRVWAESEGPNRGSRFVVVLPALEVGERRPGASADAPICVLLVEDNADTREVLAVSLESKGYRVLTAATGEEALQSMPTTRPDFVLSDLGLPGMSGYEFLESAHRLAGFESLPAFAITASTVDGGVQRAREAGFSGHFVKPVDVSALDQAIRSWLAASRLPQK